MDRTRWNVWRSLTTGAAILQIAALGAPERHAAFAQLAPPSGHPTGILGVQDHRVQIAPDTSPWSSIGRINIVGISSRGWCTGTLIAPRRVLTAAHCLFNTRTNDWVRPSSLHFVVGQARDKFLGHSAVESFSTSPEFKFKLEDRPRYDFIAHNMIRHDWAIVTLQDALQVEPIPVRAVENAELPAADKGGEIALAGYAADRQYVLSVHKGCDARIDAPERGVITPMCDSAPGESGAPHFALA